MKTSQIEIIEGLRADFEKMNAISSKGGNIINVGEILSTVNGNKQIELEVRKATESARKLLIEQVCIDFDKLKPDVESLGLTITRDIGVGGNRHYIKIGDENIGDLRIYYELKGVGVKREGMLSLTRYTKPSIYTYDSTGNHSKHYDTIEDCIADNRQKSRLIQLAVKAQDK